MNQRDMKIGATYIFPSGIVRRVIDIRHLTENYSRVTFENVNGKRPGEKKYEALAYAAGVAKPYDGQPPETVLHVSQIKKSRPAQG